MPRWLVENWCNASGVMSRAVMPVPPVKTTTGDFLAPRIFSNAAIISSASSFNNNRSQTLWPAASIISTNISPDLSVAGSRVSDRVITVIAKGEKGGCRHAAWCLLPNKFFWPAVVGDVGQGRVFKVEHTAVDPIIGHHPRHIKPCFAHRYRFNKQQWVVLINFFILHPFAHIGRAAVIGREPQILNCRQNHRATGWPNNACP